MKKIISLIAVALFATVVASGCKGFAKCEDAANKGQTVCETADNFDGKLACKFTSAGDAKDANKGTCTADPEAAAKKCADVKVEGTDAEKAKKCTDAGCQLAAGGANCEVIKK